MSAANHDDRPGRRPHPQPLAAPFLELDLSREMDQLQAEAPAGTGPQAKTLVKYDDLRIVLITLRAHGRIAQHQADGRLSIHALRGHIRLRALDRTFDLPAGRLLTLDHGVAHDVEALEDSAFLLTVAWPGRDRSGAA